MTPPKTPTAVNMGLTLLYWRIGQRINAEVLQDERAAYGEQIVATLSRQLSDDYGRSFGVKNLRHIAGFSFIARQKRIQINNDDFYIDLLLYNRKLKRLVAIDLKLGDFRAEHKGQMELHLRWLAKYETESGEAPPIGIILCTGKRQEQIELLELGASGIHVAEYLTVLPPPDVLHRKLHEAIETARARIKAKDGDRREGLA